MLKRESIQGSECNSQLFKIMELIPIFSKFIIHHMQITTINKNHKQK